MENETGIDNDDPNKSDQKPKTPLSDSNANEDWIQTIINATADGIITIDRRGRITSINKSALKMFGYEPSEVNGQNVSTLAPSPYREEHDGYLERYLRTGEAHIIGGEREVEAIRKDGTTFPIALRVTEAFYNDERIFIGTVQDITPRKKIEAERDLLFDAVRSATAELSSASSQLLAITGQQAAGAQQQAVSVSETVNTVNDVTRTVAQSTQHARDVAASAQHADEVGKTGLQAVNESLKAMGNVQHQSELISQHIVVLSDRAQAIAKIIQSVKDIADETNLLALNASIQAANAGEHGRGFSIVASEVKGLAVRARDSTAKIGQILSEIQQGIESAVMSSKKGNESVAEANEVARHTDSAIRALNDTIMESARSASQILASAQQQVTGMNQVKQAMGQIDEAAHQTLTSAQQTKRTAENLDQLGQRLKRLLEDGNETPDAESL